MSLEIYNPILTIYYFMVFTFHFVLQFWFIVQYFLYFLWFYTDISIFLSASVEKQL